MGQDSSKYAFLNTQVSLHSERLLDQEQRESLLSASKGEVGDLLVQAELSALAENPPADAAQLEQQLVDQLVLETNQMIKSLTGGGREFIRHWLRRFELINLKLILRNKLSGAEQETIKKLLIDLGTLNSVPINELVQTEGTDEFLRRLEQTHYRHMAAQARQAYKEKQSLFDVEAALDSSLLNHLNQLTYAVEKEQRARLRRLLGSLLDQINLTWLLRYRLTYKLEPAYVYFLLSSGGYRLHNKVLLDLAQQESMELILQMLPAPLNKRLDGVTSISAVEYAMIEDTRRLAHTILMSSGFVLARVFAYLYLREQQLMFIHTVLKGRMFNLDQDLIQICGNQVSTMPSMVSESA